MRKLNLASCLCVSLIILHMASSARHAEAAAPAAGSSPVKLRIAYVALSGVMAPVWMAAESGAFRSESLEVALIYIDARSAIAALVANEVDALEISAPGMIPAVLAGADITMIAGLLNKMIFSFHAQKEIKSAELQGGCSGFYEVDQHLSLAISKHRRSRPKGRCRAESRIVGASSSGFR